MWKIFSKLFLIFTINSVSNIFTLDTIINVDDDSFDNILQENPNILLLFHNSENISTTDFYIEIFRNVSKTSEKENLPIKFGIIDCSKSHTIAKRLQIDESLPILRLFVDQSPVDFPYTAVELTANSLFYFLKVKILTQSQELYLPDELEKFTLNREVLVYFGLGDFKDPKYRSFLKIARLFDDVLFAHCGTVQCIESYKIHYNNLMFFKNNHQFELHEPYTDHMIQRLVETHSTSVKTYFDEWLADIIFTRNNIGMFLFRDAKNPDHKIHELIFKRVSKFFKASNIWFVIVDIKTGLEDELAKITRVTSQSLPCIYIHDAREKNIFSYKFLDEFTEENLYKFTNDFNKSQLQPYYLSEDPIPEENQTYPILTLVGKTFNDMVLMDKENSCFIFIHGKDCEHCLKAEKMFKRLAEVLLVKNKNIVFMKFNNDLNELPSIYEALGLPNFKLFVKGKKNEPLDYPLYKDRSIKKLAEFLYDSIKDINIQDINDGLDVLFEENEVKTEF